MWVPLWWFARQESSRSFGFVKIWCSHVFWILVLRWVSRPPPCRFWFEFLAGDDQPSWKIRKLLGSHDHFLFDIWRFNHLATHQPSIQNLNVHQEVISEDSSTSINSLKNLHFPKMVWRPQVQSKKLSPNAQQGWDVLRHLWTRMVWDSS